MVLPLTVFLVLGTLQLFLMLQARLMAQYAAYWAVREGSVTRGSCGAMEAVALKALLPTFVALRGEDAVEEEARRRRGGARGYRYDPRRERGFSGDIFWVARERPLAREVTFAGEETFDQGGEPARLEVRLVFWYPLRIPFADGVMSRMFRAAFALAPLREGANPLLPVERQTRWTAGPQRLDDAALREEYARRTASGEHVFPIVTTASMRMMTPPAPEHFAAQDCVAAAREVAP